MALILIDGFDKYGPANSNAGAVTSLLQQEWTTATGVAQQIVASLSGPGQAFQMQFSGTSGLTKTLAANYARLIGGMRMQSDLVTNMGVTFLDGATAQCSVTINTTGTISLRAGNNNGTALATSSASVSASTTHYLEWDIAFSNTAAYQVWLDGVSVLSGTADTTATANNFASRFMIAGSGTTSVGKFDDLYLFDTTGSVNNAVLLTNPRVETSMPLSDNSAQFAFGSGALGTTWTRVTTSNAPLANSLVLRSFTPAVNCTLNSVTLLPQATNAVVTLAGVVYADSSGAAGTLLSSGPTQTGLTAVTAKMLPLTTPQNLTAGTQYWLGYITNTSVSIFLTDASAVGYRAANTFASGAPGTAPAMTSGQPTWHFWGDLTGVSGNNWYASAQQPPPGASSYVFDSTTGHEDLYNMAALSSFPLVHAAAVKALVMKSDSGARTLSVRLKSAGTDSGGTSFAPGTSFAWAAAYWDTNPSGSIAWTAAALNTTTCGLKVDT